MEIPTKFPASLSQAPPKNLERGLVTLAESAYYVTNVHTYICDNRNPMAKLPAEVRCLDNELEQILYNQQ